jgi:hypothetical protein
MKIGRVGILGLIAALGVIGLVIVLLEIYWDLATYAELGELTAFTFFTVAISLLIVNVMIESERTAEYQRRAEGPLDSIATWCDERMRKVLDLLYAVYPSVDVDCAANEARFGDGNLQIALDKQMSTPSADQIPIENMRRFLHDYGADIALLSDDIRAACLFIPPDQVKPLQEAHRSIRAGLGLAEGFVQDNVVSVESLFAVAYACELYQRCFSLLQAGSAGQG